MPIIKLTKAHWNDEETGEVDFDILPDYFDTTGCHFRLRIKKQYKTKKDIRCSDFNGFIVKETPEEIMRLIKEAENGK